MNTFNRFLIMAAAFSCAIGAWSQKYEVGQLITLDGHNCIVVQVDSTGEHGLAAGPSLALYDSKKYTPEKYVEKKFRGDKKKKNAPRFFQAGRLSCVLKQDLSDEEEKTLRTPILESLTSAHGEDNQRAIHQYCETKGVDMAKVFPVYHWAEGLGEGWFIGGVSEANRYINAVSRDKLHTADLNKTSIENGYPYFYPLNIHCSTHREYTGKMCSIGKYWTYYFRFRQQPRSEYNAAAKKVITKWVEVKEVRAEEYSEWYLDTNFRGSFLQGSKERSHFYDPDYNWQRYGYYLAFRKF